MRSLTMIFHVQDTNKWNTCNRLYILSTEFKNMFIREKLKFYNWFHCIEMLCISSGSMALLGWWPFTRWIDFGHWWNASATIRTDDWIVGQLWKGKFMHFQFFSVAQNQCCRTTQAVLRNFIPYICDGVFWVWHSIVCLTDIFKIITLNVNAKQFILNISIWIDLSWRWYLERWQWAGGHSY